MENKNLAFKAFLGSVFALILCFAMLIGTTFAWFTDSVSSDNNNITAGNLDIELYHTDKKATDEKVTETTKLFDDVDSDLWEPGAIAYEKFTIKNEGDLRLKYKMTLNAMNATVKNGVSFASMLKVAVVNDSFVYSRENVAALTDSEWSTLATFSKTGELAADGSAVYGIIIYWEPTANDNLFNTKDTVKVDVSIDLLATQTTGEFDSIDENYDADAELPTLSSSVVSLAPNAQGSYEDKSFGTAGENPVETILPAEVVEALAEAGVTNATLGVSEAEVDTTANTVTFKEIAFFDENGEKIDLTNNTTPIPVKLFVGLALAGEDVSIFHDDVFVAAATVDADGYVSYEALHFCEVFVETGSEYEFVANGLFKNGLTYYVNNAEGLKALNNLLANRTAGQGITIELLADIDFAGKTWTMVDSHVDFGCYVSAIHGNGCTISNLTIDGQAMFRRFAGAGDVEITNLTFDNATVSTTGINASVLTVQTYQNVLLDNVDVKNSSITGAYKVAPLIGTVYNEKETTITATLKNCDVANTVVTATQYDFCTTGMVAFVNAGDNDAIVFENCTISDVQLYAPNDSYKAHASVYTTGSGSLYNEAEGVTVTNVTFMAAKLVSAGLLKDGLTYYVMNAEGLKALNDLLANRTAGQGITIELLADIDFAGKTWTMVDSHVDFGCYVSAIHGNGHTISNMTISGQAMFSRFAGTGDVEITNLTFDNATVSTTGINASVLTVQTYQNLLLDNVDVKNSSITGAYKVAPLIGTVYNEKASTITATLKNCDVANTVVTSTQYDFFTCGMVSFVYTTDNDVIEYENCSITDVQLRSVGGGYNYHANIHYTSADTDDQINEHPGVTVTNVTFEKLA